MPNKPQKSEDNLRDFQEKKNLQDFVYETNTRLEKLSHAFISMNAFIENIKAKAESDHKALQIDIENFKESVVSKVFNVEQRMGDLETVLKSHMKNVSLQYENLSEKSIEKNDFREQMSRCMDMYDRHSMALDKYRAQVNGSIQDVRVRFADDLWHLSAQVFKEINQSDPDIEELKMTLKIFREDFESLKKETVDLKLAFGCVQKKFECVARAERQKEGKK